MNAEAARSCARKTSAKNSVDTHLCEVSQQNFLLVEIVQHVVVLLAFLGVHGLSRFSQSPLFLGTFVTDATLVATIVL